MLTMAVVDPDHYKDYVFSVGGKNRLTFMCHNVMSKIVAVVDHFICYQLHCLRHFKLETSFWWKLIGTTGFLHKVFGRTAVATVAAVEAAAETALAAAAETAMAAALVVICEAAAPAKRVVCKKSYGLCFSMLFCIKCYHTYVPLLIIVRPDQTRPERKKRRRGKSPKKEKKSHLPTYSVSIQQHSHTTWWLPLKFPSFYSK